MQLLTVQLPKGQQDFYKKNYFHNPNGVQIQQIPLTALGTQCAQFRVVCRPTTRREGTRREAYTQFFFIRDIVKIDLGMSHNSSEILPRLVPKTVPYFFAMEPKTKRFFYNIFLTW